MGHLLDSSSTILLPLLRSEMECLVDPAQVLVCLSVADTRLVRVAIFEVSHRFFDLALENLKFLIQQAIASIESIPKVPHLEDLPDKRKPKTKTPADVGQKGNG